MRPTGGAAAAAAAEPAARPSPHARRLPGQRRHALVSHAAAAAAGRSPTAQVVEFNLLLRCRHPAATSASRPATSSQPASRGASQPPSRGASQPPSRLVVERVNRQDDDQPLGGAPGGASRLASQPSTRAPLSQPLAQPIASEHAVGQRRRPRLPQGRGAGRGGSAGASPVRLSDSGDLGLAVAAEREAGYAEGWPRATKAAARRPSFGMGWTRVRAFSARSRLSSFSRQMVCRAQQASVRSGLSLLRGAATPGPWGVKPTISPAEQYLAPAAEKSGEEVTISDLLPQGSLGITATTDSTAAGSSSSASMALHGRKRGDDEAEEMEL